MAVPMREETWVPQDTLGRRMRLVRDELGLTVEELARELGVPAATLSTWERGARPRDLIDVVSRYANVTNVDRDWLMGWTRNSCFTNTPVFTSHLRPVR